RGKWRSPHVPLRMRERTSSLGLIEEFEGSPPLQRGNGLPSLRTKRELCGISGPGWITERSEEWISMNANVPNGSAVRINGAAVSGAVMAPSPYDFPEYSDPVVYITARSRRRAYTKLIGRLCNLARQWSLWSGDAQGQ